MRLYSHDRREIRGVGPRLVCATNRVNSLRRVAAFRSIASIVMRLGALCAGKRGGGSNLRQQFSEPPPEKGPRMDGTKTISGEFEAMLPALADTMRYATQALAQSAAVYEVLIAKGLATKEELEAALCSSVPIEDQFAALDLRSKKN